MTASAAWYRCNGAKRTRRGPAIRGPLFHLEPFACRWRGVPGGEVGYAKLLACLDLRSRVW